MSETLPPQAPPRILPPLTPLNRAFWTGGADRKLLILRCEACRRWVHPPSADCPDCGEKLSAEAASGKGTIFTYTVNHQRFHPDVPPPYVIAVVELVEQPDLRIPANIVNCELEELRCSMGVRVLFERHGEHFVPCFEPDEGAR
jgi:uncharacterized OB-fold protein